MVVTVIQFSENSTITYYFDPLVCSWHIAGSLLNTYFFKRILDFQSQRAQLS